MCYRYSTFPTVGGCWNQRQFKTLFARLMTGMLLSKSEEMAKIIFLTFSYENTLTIEEKLATAILKMSIFPLESFLSYSHLVILPL